MGDNHNKPDDSELPQYYLNHDLENIVTPIDVNKLEELLTLSNYPDEKKKYLVNGFRHGFDIGYRGPRQRCSVSDNIPIRIGLKLDMWNKIMKEVKLGRYAGPFDKIPYKYYIQSPIGLVPKDGGKKTHLIFHLSYNFGDAEEDRSLNYHMPDELCSVHYRDLDHAVMTSLGKLV